MRHGWLCSLLLGEAFCDCGSLDLDDLIAWHAAQAIPSSRRAAS